MRDVFDLPALTGLLLCLAALLIETRKPKAGWPVLVLLALAGLLRPEAWLFAGFYFLWLALDFHLAPKEGPDDSAPDQRPGVTLGRLRIQLRESGIDRNLILMACLTAAGPVIWVLFDLITTSNPLYSFTGTRETVETLDYASNYDVFMVQATNDTTQLVSGMDIQVISREEEARFGYLAAVNSTTISDGAILDLGGGSLQLVHVRDRRAVELDSWRLGAVRMTERFLADGEPASRKTLDRLRSHVAGKLARDPWVATLASEAPTRLVGLGGTIRNLAAAARRAAGVPELGAQGYRVETQALDELVARLAALPARERGTVPGIKPARADIVLAGAVAVQTVLREVGAPALEVTEAGLREGVFFDRSVEGDPPLVGDVRRASVENLAAQYHVEPAHTAHVAALALGLFDDLARAGLHAGDPEERELLWAAAILHDIGVSVDYDDHHKHTRYLILNAGLPGFSPAEVALIAQATRYHRKGMPEAGELSPLLDERALARLDRCAVLLRLAEDLERSRDQLVRRVLVAVSEDTVTLTLDTGDEAAAVPRWAARRETDLFARAFGGAELRIA